MKRNQLEETLSSLVADFGHKKVQNRLDALKPHHAAPAKYEKQRGTANTAGQLGLKPNKRRDAVMVVQSLGLNDSEKEAIIIDMAQRYEAKKFMPNVNHVRAFLESLGEDVRESLSTPSFLRRAFNSSIVPLPLSELQCPQSNCRLSSVSVPPRLRGMA